MLDSHLKSMKFFYDLLGAKGVALVIGSIALLLAVIVYSVGRTVKEHGISRGILYFVVPMAVAIGFMSYFRFGNPNLAPALLEWLGHDVIVGICAVLGAVGVAVGRSKFTEKFGLSRGQRGALASVPILLAWFGYIGIADWQEIITEKGNYQLSKQSTENQSLIVSRYKNLEVAFSKKDYATTIQEADQILALMPNGYHFTAEYRGDSQTKLAAQVSTAPDTSRTPSQIPAAAPLGAAQPASSPSIVPAH